MKELNQRNIHINKITSRNDQGPRYMGPPGGMGMA